MDALNVAPSTPTTDAALATVMRAAQWRLDEVAANLPAGRVSNDALADLADALDSLARHVRARAGAVVDAQP